MMTFHRITIHLLTIHLFIDQFAAIGPTHFGIVTVHMLTFHQTFFGFLRANIIRLRSRSPQAFTLHATTNPISNSCNYCILYPVAYSNIHTYYFIALNIIAHEHYRQLYPNYVMTICDFYHLIFKIFSTIKRQKDRVLDTAFLFPIKVRRNSSNYELHPIVIVTKLLAEQCQNVLAVLVGNRQSLNAQLLLNLQGS